MPPASRLNKILFAAYLVLTVGVLAAAWTLSPVIDLGLNVGGEVVFADRRTPSTRMSSPVPDSEVTRSISSATTRWR